MAQITENKYKKRKTVPKGAALKALKKTAKKPQIKFLLPKDKLLKIHDLMLQSRVLEERLIKIYKVGEAFFWIGGPGEEAFGVPLGLLAKKGQGPAYDWFHLHYRCTPILIAMGMPMIDSIRLIMNRSTDICTGGRNFSNHYCFPKWNVARVSSPIEVQYSQALGTAWVQKRTGKNGITVITGGDAGSAEGDFASCLVWASRKGHELPMLITVQNNQWGISTPYEGQHGEQHIADRGKGFNIKSAVINGNDPEEAYIKLEEAMAYIRKTGRPFLLEAMVSRLYGHSSATGATLEAEVDCLKVFEQRLLRAGHLKEKELAELRTGYEQEARAAQEQARHEPEPTSDSIWDNYYVDNENGDWRKF